MQGYPGLWRRIGAYAIDALVVAPLGIAAYWVASRDGSFGMAVAASSAAILAGLLYRIVSHAVWGRTIGKRVVGLLVVDHYDRGPLGFRQALVRELLSSVLVLWEGLLVLGTLVFHAETAGGIALDVGEAALTTGSSGALDADERGRVLHDRLAGTVVVPSARSR